MKKQNRVQKGTIIATWGLVALLGGYVCLRFIVNKPSLLSKATPLVVGTAWVQSYGGYFWENDHTVLTFRQTQNRVEAVSVDVLTGGEVLHPQLSKLIAQSASTDVGYWRLSPDGGRLLWRNVLRMPGPSQWSVSELNGKTQRMTNAVQGGNAAFWAPGTRDWLELRYNDVIASTIHHERGKDQSLSPLDDSLNFPFAYSPDGRVLSIDQPDKKRVFGWTEYDLAKRPVAHSSRRITRPEGCETVFEAELSPDGDKVACLFTAPIESGFTKILERFIPNYQPASEHSELWVFSRDGAKRHLVGVENGIAITGVLWTQDSKRISLLGGGKLYTVNPDN